MLTGRTRTWGWVAAGPPASLPPSPRAPWTPALAPELTFPNTPASSLPGSRQTALSKVSPRTRPHRPLARSKVGVQRSWPTGPVGFVLTRAPGRRPAAPMTRRSPARAPQSPESSVQAGEAGTRVHTHTRTHTRCTHVHARMHTGCTHTHAARICTCTHTRTRAQARTPVGQGCAKGGR